MKDFARALRYIPGYKNIIFFSSGFPRGLLYGQHQPFRESYEEMSKELATSNCPVFAVNTEGARAYSQPGQAAGSKARAARVFKVIDKE